MNKRVRPTSNDFYLMRGGSTSSDFTNVRPKDTENRGRWLDDEDKRLLQGVKNFPEKWSLISNMVGTRTTVQCRQRWQKVLRPGLVKGQWKKEEDERLIKAMEMGFSDWTKIAELVDGRTPKQCRERWKHHLDPSVKKSKWTEDEDAIVLREHDKYGNKWSKIAKSLPGRTANSVKIRMTTLSKRMPGHKKTKKRQKDVGKILLQSTKIFPVPKELPSSTLNNDSSGLPPDRRALLRSGLPPTVPNEIVKILKDLESENHSLRMELDSATKKLQMSTRMLKQRTNQLRSALLKSALNHDRVSAIRHRAHSFGDGGVASNPHSPSVSTVPNSMLASAENGENVADKVSREKMWPNLGDTSKLPWPKTPKSTLPHSFRSALSTRNSSGMLSFQSDSRMGSSELLELEGFISRELSDHLKSLEMSDISNLISDGAPIFVPTPRESFQST